MHEELIEKLRCCVDQIRCGDCRYVKDCDGDRMLMSQAADAIEELSARVDSLQVFADNISKLPDCNTCLKKDLCEFVPKYGEYCRINCHAWLGVPEPPKGKHDGI